MVKLFFVGKDKRSEYLKKYYEEEATLVDSVDKADYIILPIPFTKDGIHITGEEILIDEFIFSCINKTIFTGGIVKEFRRKLEMNNVRYIDLMDKDEIAYLNAIPTAEGAIKKAIEETDITIHGANVLVLGFGRVGKILSDKLKGLNANVFCEARNEKDLAHITSLGYNGVDLKNIMNYLDKMDIIFSTVPTLVLTENKLKAINKDAVIIDLASSPGSVDYIKANELNLKAYLELGIPSKIAPRSAARYLKETMDKIIYDR